MYVAARHQEMRPELLHGLIRTHPLGIVVTHGAGGLDANHIPFELAPATENAPHGVLRAHVARGNSLWRQDGADALVVFQGPTGYVTPAVFEEKTISGEVVPTYNYAVVHAHGKLRTIEDPVWILALLERLTAHHESSRPAPWSVQDAPPAYIERMMKAIVGIEIPIERLQGKWKIGQNDSEQDQRRMEETMSEQMVTMMRERRALSAA